MGKDNEKTKKSRRRAAGGNKKAADGASELASGAFIEF
jgi:X-X-X-Leu-X-X-Gly heptad repeat protein